MAMGLGIHGEPGVKRVKLQTADEIVSELVDKTRQELAFQDETLAGTVALGSGELEAVRVMPRLFQAFRMRYPLVDYTLYSGTADDVKERMDRGLLDAGILLEPVDVEKYEFIRLPVREQWIALMPADDPLAEREAILEAFTAPDEFEQSPDFAGMDDNSVISTDPSAFNPPKSNGRANAASAPTEPEAKKEDLPDLPVIRDEDDMAEAFVPRLRPEGVNLKDMITDIEISMIKQALEQTNGVVAKAAETLGLRRTTLIEKMKKYGLTAQ